MKFLLTLMALTALVAISSALPATEKPIPQGDASLNEVETINAKQLAEKQNNKEQQVSGEEDGLLDIDVERNVTSGEGGEESEEDGPSFPIIYGITRVRVFAIPVLHRPENSTDEDGFQEDGSQENESDYTSSNCTVIDDGNNSTDTSSGCRGQGGLRHYLVRLFCHRSIFLDFTICQLFK